MLRRASLGEGGYGALRPAGPELALPEGFSYTVLSSPGKPMSDAHATPGAFDGMAAFPMPNGNVRLIRNHENRNDAATARVKGDPARAYDAHGGGGTTSLEGCWYGDASIYFHATNGGDAQVGQVWRYLPTSHDRGDLLLVFESPSPDVLDYPDNITVSPRGGIVICEDGGGEQYLPGLTPQGAIFDLGKNLLNASEFAGGCFSPDGRVLFVNIMGATLDNGAEEGRTLAIRGPWERGAL